MINNNSPKNPLCFPQSPYLPNSESPRKRKQQLELLSLLGDLEARRLGEYSGVIFACTFPPLSSVLRVERKQYLRVTFVAWGFGGSEARSMNLIPPKPLPSPNLPENHTTCAPRSAAGKESTVNHSLYNIHPTSNTMSLHLPCLFTQIYYIAKNISVW